MSRLSFAVAIVLFSALVSAASAQPININIQNLIPEGVEHSNGNFFVSSFSYGSVYKVTTAGVATPFVVDPRLLSTAGLKVDSTRNFLYVVNINLGYLFAGVPTGFQSAVAVANLATGAVVKYIDLSNVTSSMNIPRFANDVTFDENGHLFVSDSFGNQIWKIHGTTNEATVFVQSASFAGDARLNPNGNLFIGPNGIEYHNGYLVLAISGTLGKIFKIPIVNGAAGTPVQVSVTGYQPYGLDGISFIPGTDVLFAIDNARSRFYLLSGSNNFASAVSVYAANTTYPTPTSVTVVNGVPYVVSAMGFQNVSSYPVFSVTVTLPKESGAVLNSASLSAVPIAIILAALLIFTRMF